MKTALGRITDLNTQELQELSKQLRAEYEAQRKLGLKLDMTRGKPSPEQLDLANELLSMPGRGRYAGSTGEDARNYGNPQGLPEARKLFAFMLGASPDRVAIGASSSLALMHDTIVWAMLKGVPGSPAPWSHINTKDQAPAFICPVPGYDRHFAICEEFAVRMLPVPLTGNGPDMDKVEELAADPSVKGMWAVPKYSNPTGEIYSADTVQRLASMRTGAPDFRIFWDNAYCVHHLTERRHEIANILELCERAGNPDRAFVFASTSKVTFAGAGLAFFGSSQANMAWFLARFGKQTIGPDKLNQLRHVQLLRDEAGVHRHMDAHRALLAPKFDAVVSALEARLNGTGVANWSKPEGGYFISVDAAPGTARRVVELSRVAGVALTPAGATWPRGQDPYDRTLRLAPSYPSMADVRAASEVIALCILLAAVESHLAELTKLQFL